MANFSFEAASRHIRKKHPGCPDFAVDFFAKEIAGRSWEGVTLGRAVGITMQGSLRHQMTEYDTLLLHAVEREEARKRVQPKINAMLAVWERRPETDENT